MLTVDSDRKKLLAASITGERYVLQVSFFVYLCAEDQVIVGSIIIISVCIAVSLKKYFDSRTFRKRETEEWKLVKSVKRQLSKYVNINTAADHLHRVSSKRTVFMTLKATRI